MQCPRCGNQWDQKKGLCPHCGLTIRNIQSNAGPYTETIHSNWATRSTEASNGQQARSSFSVPSKYASSPLRSSSPLNSRPTTSSDSEFVYPALRSASQPLFSGNVLRNRRYSLQTPLSRQQWRANVFEASWSGFDAQRGNAQVVIREVVLSEISQQEAQSILQTAVRTFASLNTSPSIPKLLDAFRENEHNFFIFESVEGESLLARARRIMSPLPEQEVLKWCLQIVGILEVLGQQSPPLIHGLIQPDVIIAHAHDPLYSLTNFSLVLAGGAKQYVAGTERRLLSPYAAPEIARGTIDTRADIYALLATAYHMVTGFIPEGTSIGSITPARKRNPSVSLAFDEILTKGLHPVPGQRYQQPQALREALLSAVTRADTTGRQTSTYPGTFQPGSSQASTVKGFSPEGQVQLPVAPTLPFEQEKQHDLLPGPEELPPLSENDDKMFAGIVFTCIFVVLSILVILSHVVG